MSEQYDQYQESVYIGYVYLPNSHCRLRFLPLEGEPAEHAPVERKEQDVPLWAFTVALVVIAVLIGLGGSFLLLPYGGLCR